MIEPGEGTAEVYDQVVDRATADQILFDIGAAAELIAVMIKGDPERYARGGGGDLEAAAAALDAGAAGIQLRYRYQGAEWWDTLLPVAAGIRLVRTRVP
jgi:hypothetical protein